MSYCVNCGVELDNSLDQCPMCQTKVYNPNALVIPGEGKSPYPENKGTVERVKRTDVAILITSVLGSIVVTCGLLNTFIFTQNGWSLVVIGSCLVLWVTLIPFMFSAKQSPYLYVLYDGVAMLLYLVMIGQLTAEKSWLYGIAIPISIAVTMVVELVVFCIRQFKKSFLANALFVFTGIGVVNVVIEIIVDLYFTDQIKFGWSAIVATVCVIIDIFLITVLSSRRLRNALSRRFHF